MGNLVTTAHSHLKKHRMCILLALLCLSILTAHQGASLPSKEEFVRKTIQNILNIAQITLVHIKKITLPVSLQTEILPSIEGLTSISHDLGVLANELQSLNTEVLSQIQADVSSLEGMVRSLILTMDCPLHAIPTAKTSDSMFPESYLYMTLTKVQHYPENLLLNKSKFKIC